MKRYSQAFKMQAVREVESGERCAYGVGLKYDIKGTDTVMRWVRQLGSGKYGKVIRVEKANEVNEAARLRSQLRQAKEALADAHMELALEKAFLVVACEQMGQSPEAFKKSMLAGGAPRARSKPGVQSGATLRTGQDDAAKLLCAPHYPPPSGSGVGIGPGVGARGKAAAGPVGGAQSLSLN